MRIGFDFDKVFIDYPPFIPDSLIDWLFKNHGTKKLSYRIPGRLEQQLRRVSHMPVFRPPIQDNISFVQELAKEKKHTLYLISSRFSFLEDITSLILKRYGLADVFTKMEFDYANKQPHLFKDEVIRRLHLHMYVDDDLPLLRFVADKNSKTKLFWIHRDGYGIKTGTITRIKVLSDLRKLHLI